MQHTLGQLPIRVSTTPDADAAERLHGILSGAQQTDAPVLLLAAGGSAFSVLEHLDTSVFGAYLTIAVLDERYDPSNEASNFRIMSDTGICRALERAGGSCIDSSTQSRQTQEDLRRTYEDGLREWVDTHSHGMIVATVGVGPDGHVAGIMPDSEHPDVFADRFEQTSQWVVAYDAGPHVAFPYRVTTTFPFLDMIDYGLVYVTGEQKAEMFQTLVQESVPLHTQPAQFLKRLPRGDCFIDEALAGAAGIT